MSDKVYILPSFVLHSNVGGEVLGSNSGLKHMVNFLRANVLGSGAEQSHFTQQISLSQLHADLVSSPYSTSMQ